MTKSPPPPPPPPPSTSPHVITCSPSTTSDCSNTNSSSNIIVPVEIISEEEMALLESALAATRSYLSSSTFPSISSPPRASIFYENARSIQSITSLAKRRLVKECRGYDMEDLGGSRGTQKRTRKDHVSLYSRFRKRTGLSVTDITSTEWCEKQMEFVLQFGRRTNDAMKAGTARHVKLEEEVFKKVKVSTESIEDVWALKFMNFITGVNQLMVEGLTRELPLIGFAEGFWIVGVVDEIRMQGETERIPILVDTKTRVRDTLPGDPQRRNGRLQLMCYKSLWDKAIADEFPSRQFFDSFSLNPYNILSEEIRQSSARASIPAKTLDDVIMYYRNTCSMLVPADNQLLIRYESQRDNSVLSEDQFLYDPDWLKRQIQDSLEFWMGEREPKYVPEEERWKCRYCQFNPVCPAAAVPDPSSPSATDNS